VEQLLRNGGIDRSRLESSADTPAKVMPLRLLG
jgi:hypothetical protein